MRIQILTLPSVMVGDDMDEPFALIVDQHDSDLDQQTAEEWQRFKTSAGARALLITPDTVEVVGRYAEPAHKVAEMAGCVHCDNGELSVVVACACATPCWNPDCPKARPAATDGTLFDKPVRLEWPEGPPLGLSRQTLTEKLRVFGATLLEPNPTVLSDRNGSPMNILATCSCGKAMGRAWNTIDSDPRQERTEIACNGCGNRLTVTVPLGDQT
ncbi:hypothetical protein [Nonomuraea basaltis]|uniref:hypothetical protein n=1 Tax=Nonomuraea basaltis TaxID=2495887 RepID=UPI00110C45B5|nr:hypothetical protein [Nonomuraea basaltis]TMS00176.1 hypothetical protein EJK15_03635 [Nonomuraea basaltis]